MPSQGRFAILALFAVVASLTIAGTAIGVAGSSQGPSSTPFGKPTAEDPEPSTGITAVAGERAPGWGQQKRSEVLARNGIVATSQPLAAQAGLQVLHEGGNAADAAVAAAATAAVVEPLSTSPGGDMFALYWSAKDRKLYALNASGWSPKAWTLDYFHSKGYDAKTGMPIRGADAVTVPGAVDGWDQLLKRFGTMRFKQVLQPAEELAQYGFGLTERERSDWKEWVSTLREDPDSARTWLVDGQAPPLYGIFRNPELAHTFQVLEKKGRDAFYEGQIADAIVKKVQASGGVMTKSDLAQYHSEWVDPISTEYHGYDVWETPPNSQGFAVLEMLNILETCVPQLGYDLRELGPRSPEYWHLMVEAKKLAYADLLRYNADPRVSEVPVAKLTSKAYAATLCDRIDPNRATPLSEFPTISEKGGTVYITAADRWGNMVSFIYSEYWPFGSGLTVPGYGFILQNRGNGFSLDPQSPDVVAPRKRPFNTIIPGFVTKEGKPVLSFGNMGGPVQAQAQAQELVDMIDLGMNVQAAGDAARFSHDQSSDVLSLEPPLYNLVGAQLAAMGYDVKVGRGDDLGAGGYQAILFEQDPSLPVPKPRDHRTPVNGVYRAGSDVRKDGEAVGW